MELSKSQFQFLRKKGNSLDEVKLFRYICECDGLFDDRLLNQIYDFLINPVNIFSNKSFLLSEFEYGKMLRKIPGTKLELESFKNKWKRINLVIPKNLDECDRFRIILFRFFRDIQSQFVITKNTITFYEESYKRFKPILGRELKFCDLEDLVAFQADLLTKQSFEIKKLERRLTLAESNIYEITKSNSVLKTKIKQLQKTEYNSKVFKILESLQGQILQLKQACGI